MPATQPPRHQPHPIPTPQTAVHPQPLLSFWANPLPIWFVRCGVSQADWFCNVGCGGRACHAGGPATLDPAPPLLVTPTTATGQTWTCPPSHTVSPSVRPSVSPEELKVDSPTACEWVCTGIGQSACTVITLCRSHNLSAGTQGDRKLRDEITRCALCPQPFYPGTTGPGYLDVDSWYVLISLLQVCLGMGGIHFSTCPSTLTFALCLAAHALFGSAGLLLVYPPPPVSKNHLAQEPTPGSAVKFSHHFFYQGSGFFMFLVDVGQLFRCAGHHFMCVTMGPPIRGDPISHSQAHSFVNVVNCGKGEGTHVLAQRAGKFFFFRGTGLPTAVRKNQPLVPRSNLGGKVCARTNPWFRGQTWLVLGHGGGGYLHITSPFEFKGCSRCVWSQKNNSECYDVV